MSSVVNRDEDTHPYLVSGNFPSTGGFLHNIHGGGNPLRGDIVLYDRLDVCISDWSLTIAFPLGAAQEFCRFDPLLLDNTGPLFTGTYTPGVIDTLDCSDIAIGHWNRITNEQKIYAFHSGVSAIAAFHEVQPLALNVMLDYDPWPNVGPLESRNGLIAGDPYFYNSAQGNWVFFEDYGKGYITASNWYDDSGVLKRRVMLEVDLATGNATVVPCPIYYGLANPNEYTEAPLYTKNHHFTGLQFVQDDDDTPNAPKGVMYFFSDVQDDPTDALNYRMWYKIVDWNPTGKVGIPNRIHLRERLLSAFSLIKNAFTTSPNGVDEYGTGGYSFNVIYHPNSNLMFLSTSRNVGGGHQLDSWEQKMLYVAPGAVFSSITNPYAMSRISTGKVTAFAVEALGDLQEPITGVDVNWSLENESTVDEVLAVTPTPGETVTLANTVNPVDAVISPMVVKKNGVVMTEGTGAGEVEFLRGSSQVKFYSPEPDTASPAYTCTYRHWDDPQASPHGDLLNTTSSSDANGVAIARVRYAEEDPVPDRWDRISAEDV